MDVFRVNYVYRASKDSNPVEKIVFVVAKNEQAAIAFIQGMIASKRDKISNHLLEGNEVQSVSTYVKNVIGSLIPLDPPERRISLVDSRPLPKVERRLGGVDSRVGELPGPAKPVVLVDRPVEPNVPKVA